MIEKCLQTLCALQLLAALYVSVDCCVPPERAPPVQGPIVIAMADMVVFTPLVVRKFPKVKLFGKH